jgi:NADH:ubiquinone reductase (non-electrogenic)
MYFNSFVQKINQKSLEIKDKEPLSFDMAIWCGGIKISELSKKVNRELKLDNNRGIPVDKYLNVENKQNIFAIGDCAYSGNPPTAQVAYQQGIYLANQFNNDFKKKEKFVFNDKGQIGYIGNGKSVYQNNYLKGGGRITYYLNTFVHLYNFGKIYVKSKF